MLLQNILSFIFSFSLICVEIPIITSVYVHIPGYDPLNGIVQQWIVDAPRYIIAGCISGEVVIFKWTSESIVTTTHGDERVFEDKIEISCEWLG